MDGGWILKAGSLVSIFGRKCLEMSNCLPNKNPFDSQFPSESEKKTNKNKKTVEKQSKKFKTQIFVCLGLLFGSTTLRITISAAKVTNYGKKKDPLKDKHTSVHEQNAE